MTKLGCRNGAASWAECSGGTVRSRGAFGASQSFGLRRQASWLKVWRGGGCKFSATERAHKRNGGQVDAECRWPSLVTTGMQQNQGSGVREKPSLTHSSQPTTSQNLMPSLSVTCGKIFTLLIYWLGCIRKYVWSCVLDKMNWS